MDERYDDHRRAERNDDTSGPQHGPTGLTHRSPQRGLTGLNLKPAVSGGRPAGFDLSLHINNNSSSSSILTCPVTVP